jgi:hypothetical protein
MIPIMDKVLKIHDKQNPEACYVSESFIRDENSRIIAYEFIKNKNLIPEYCPVLGFIEFLLL